MGSQHPDAPFPLSLPSLATHTPAAQNQALRSWAGGGAGCGADTHTGWEGALAADLWEGAWSPDTWLLRKEGSRGKPMGLRRAQQLPSLSLVLLEAWLPLQSLPLQSPPAIAAVG